MGKIHKKNKQQIEKTNLVKAREFTLVDKKKRHTTDLRDYENEITEAVFTVFDIGEDDLLINEDSFMILNYQVKSREAIKLGRILSSRDSSLFPLCKNYPILFIGEKVKELGITEYYLANSEMADITDLRMFGDIITNTVKQVSPDTEVEIYTDYYSVKSLSAGAAREIGKRLGQNPQLQYLKKDRFVLFEGKDVLLTM